MDRRALVNAPVDVSSPLTARPERFASLALTAADARLAALLKSTAPRILRLAARDLATEDLPTHEQSVTFAMEYIPPMVARFAPIIPSPRYLVVGREGLDHAVPTSQ
jgi:hypothetical protein